MMAAGVWGGMQQWSNQAGAGSDRFGAAREAVGSTTRRRARIVRLAVCGWWVRRPCMLSTEAAVHCGGAVRWRLRGRPAGTMPQLRRTRQPAEVVRLSLLRCGGGANNPASSTPASQPLTGVDQGEGAALEDLRHGLGGLGVQHHRRQQARRRQQRGGSHLLRLGGEMPIGRGTHQGGGAAQGAGRLASAKARHQGRASGGEGGCLHDWGMTGTQREMYGREGAAAG